MPTETIPVPEVHCGHCVSSIEGALSPLAGVTAAAVDLESRSVTVTFDDAAISHDAIVAAIEEQGYAVGEQPGGLPIVN